MNGANHTGAADGSSGVSEFTDLWLTGGLLVAATAALLAPGVPRPIEWTLGGLYLLVVPGYAVVSALFPRAPTADGQLVMRTSGGPAWTARVALTLVISVLVVGVVGVLLGWTAGITLLTVVVTLDGVTITALAAARYRRLAVPSGERAAPLRLFRERDSVGHSTGQTLAMVLALFVLASALAFAAASAPSSDGHTEVALLTEGPNGTYVADNYPSTLVADQAEPFSVMIDNGEGEQRQYGVVMLAQDVNADGDVVAQERVDEFTVTLEDGERRVIDRSITPTRTGQAVRLRLLVYDGAVPESPSVDTAEHELHVWVDVTGGETG